MHLGKWVERTKARFIRFLSTCFTTRNTAPPTAVAVPLNSPTPASIGAQVNAVENWPRLKSLLHALDNTPFAFGPLKTMFEGFVSCIETYESVGNRRQDYDELRNNLEAIFRELEHHLTQTAAPALTASMESLCRCILMELEYVRRKQGRETLRRHIEARGDPEAILACYRRLQRYLQRLCLNANLSMWRILEGQSTHARLQSLRPPFLARYNSAQAEELRRRICTQGTRAKVLTHMHDWIRKPEAGSVYWLNGMAGTGKTTIAHSLCTQLDTTYQLGASFFCSRLLPECKKVNLIIPSIAYQLAQFSRPFKYALSRVLELDQDVHELSIQLQFKILIVKPLVDVRDALPESLVVVIDALDECDNQKCAGQILDALFTFTPDLPIKFLVSSRPESEIRDQMQKQEIDHRSSSRVVLHELDRCIVRADIEAYIREALDPMKLGEREIAMLVERAGLWFIYAATVTRYIGYDNFKRNPHARLQTILSVSGEDDNNPYKDIDNLYTIILKAAISDPELSGWEREDIQQVLNTTICAREPLTIAALSGLLGLHDVGRVHAALRPLWSVLHVVEASGLVTTLHVSFPDYMFDSSRSKEFYCDLVAHNHTLAYCCFDFIRRARPHLDTSMLDRTFIDLNATIRDAISSGLSYACRYWATHLQHVRRSPDIIERLEIFLSELLLLWMKVMDIEKRGHDRQEMLWQTERWCIHQDCPEELVRKIRQARESLASKEALGPTSGNFGFHGDVCQSMELATKQRTNGSDNTM